MSIEYAERIVMFGDVVGVEEAESLLEWMQGHPDATADFALCTHLHPANLQVLMAGRIPVRTWPTDPILATWLASALHAELPSEQYRHGALAA